MMMMMMMMMMMTTLMKLFNSATKFRHGMDKFYQPNSGLRGPKSRDEAIYTYIRDSFSSSLAMLAPENFSASSSFREVTRGFTSILSEPLEMVQMILTYIYIYTFKQ